MADVNCYLPTQRPGFITAPITSSIGDNWYIYRGTARLFPARPAVTAIIKPGTPVEINRDHNAYLSFNIIDRFYNRIIIEPLHIDLGSIGTDTEFDVSIWNSFFNTKTLTNININDSVGIELDGPQIPLAFGRLTMNKWRIKVLAEGAPDIYYVVTFSFLGLPPISVIITGRRTIPWLYSPDWNDVVEERLEWLTNVITSQTGAEQRRARRLSPRQSFEFSIITADIGRQRFEQQIYVNGSRVWSIPIYCDGQRLMQALSIGNTEIALTTAGYDLKADGLIMLQFGDVSELYKISEIYDNRVTLTQPIRTVWPVNTVVYPVKTGYLANTPQITRLTDSIIKARVRFAINEHNNYSKDYVFTQYRDKPVFEVPSDWSEDLTSEYYRLTKQIDNQTGLVTTVDTAGRAFVVQRHRWVAFTRVEHDMLRRFFYYLNGRQKSIWLSSQNSDFSLVNDISGTVIDVMNNGFTVTPGRQDICIELFGHQRIYRRIINITELNNGLLRLALDGAVMAYPRKHIVKISLLSLCRLNSDEIYIEHLTDADGVATVTTEFRGVRDELE